MTLPSDSTYLHLVTNFARNAARAGGLSDGDAEKLALATDEAVTNVIEHAYHGQPDRQIEVRVRLDADVIAVHVIHDGEPVDLSALPERLDPEEIARTRKRGGLGVILMRRLVDRVVYGETDDSRSECCLWKVRRHTAPRE